MRELIVFAGMTAFVAVGGLGCNKDRGTPTAAAAPSEAPKATKAAGGGDGSGSSIPNARGLTKAAPVTFSVPCSGAMYIGPFAFTKDPEELKLHASAKTPSGDQICVGGQWVDSAGKFLEVAGVGCPEAAHVAESDLKLTYSPGNGGLGAKQVYLMTKFDEPKPVGCKSAEVTLSVK
jgi:hypothetical protein